MDSVKLEFDVLMPGLAVALAIGLLVGAEREWSQRLEKPSGSWRVFARLDYWACLVRSLRC